MVRRNKGKFMHRMLAVLRSVAARCADGPPPSGALTPGRGERAAPGRLSLALQGGGSFGAFTWGVLDRLLEEDAVDFDAISGVSAGAINGVILASGLASGGRAAARAGLERFWRRASEAAPRSSGKSMAFDLSTRILSPYQFNPLDLNPLRALIAAEIDFEAVRRRSPLRLLVGATRVSDGHLRIFRETEMTPDVVLASACLPLLNQAMTIEGRPIGTAAMRRTRR